VAVEELLILEELQEMVVQVEAELVDQLEELRVLLILVVEVEQAIKPFLQDQMVVQA
jgi:hypothetical protein